jgi:predicted metal-dependent phosphoesterase TrpH
MIDLHTHTDASDGSFSAERLVGAASQVRLEALGITDHDTFAGYERAIPFAAECGLDLVCGIELSTKYRGRSVHLLGYFLNSQPSEEFLAWIAGLQASRHFRNRQLVEKLQAKGCSITLEEVRQKGGSLPGRPHFAALLVEKGVVTSIQQAFDDYLDESAMCYAPREEPTFQEGTERIAAGGGVPCLPHPCRVSRDHRVLEQSVREMRGMGLKGIEAYHSEHSEADCGYYESLARSLDLVVTGGSDFHGEVKPNVALGTGRNGNVRVPRSVLENLRRATP